MRPGCCTDRAADGLDAFRVREDRGAWGRNVTVRYLSRLSHMASGARTPGERVKLLIADDQVRVLGPDGTLLRQSSAMT